MDEIQNGLKQILRELLKDVEIRESIAEIARKDREQEEEFRKIAEVLEEEKRLLYRQLEEAQTECGKLREECRRLMEENREACASREEAYSMLRSREKDFAPLEDIKEIWNGISGLDESQKSYLKNLCGSWDVKSFVALGKDKNGIRQLWNFIRDEIMNLDRKPEDIRVLSEYFDLCINVYNMTNIRKECYERTEVPIGGEYDSRQWIKTSESVVNGVVKAVLLNGCSTQDDAIKPIVLVQ